MGRQPHAAQQEVLKRIFSEGGGGVSARPKRSLTGYLGQAAASNGTEGGIERRGCNYKTPGTSVGGAINEKTKEGSFAAKQTPLRESKKTFDGQGEAAEKIKPKKRRTKNG